jgi:aminoglycoside phosphotransferase (APT) family kinase protein
MVPEALVSLVSRALRTSVEEADVERVATTPLVEADRITWRASGGGGSLIFSRLTAAVSLEAQLLPFLSRKGLPVPRVLARGLPPPHANERRPWLLTEEVSGSSLCEVASEANVRRAAAIIAELQRATSHDAPALTALGVPALDAARIRDEALVARRFLDPSGAQALETLAERLDVTSIDSIGATLVHGTYGCSNVIIDGTGAIVVDWTRAHLGCPLLDLARLTDDLRAPELRAAAIAGYGADGRRVDDVDLLRRLFEVRWCALLVTNALVGPGEAAAACAPWLEARSVEG